MLLNRSDSFVLVSLDELQLQWVLWLGEGDRQRGVRRAINFVESCAFNYPTHPELKVPGKLFDTEFDYIGYYEVNPPAEDDSD